MDTGKINVRLTRMEKFCWLSLSYLLFFLIYSLCGQYASNIGATRSFAFKFEQDIPFIPWMIIPYMSSGLFFVWIFFLCSTKGELYLLVKRLNFLTIISGICFILIPMKYSFAKPQVNCEFFNFFFRILNQWDTSYNQAPSLHISYACIFWSIVRKKTIKIWKGIIGAWLLLMGISTLTIYQHHLIDVITSLGLIYITFLIFPGTFKNKIQSIITN